MIVRTMVVFVLVGASHFALAQETKPGEVVSIDAETLAREVDNHRKERGATRDRINTRYKGNKYRISGAVTYAEPWDGKMAVIWSSLKQRSGVGAALLGRKVDVDRPSLVCLMAPEDIDYALGLKNGGVATLNAEVMMFATEGKYASGIGGSPGTGALYMFCSRAPIRN